MKPIKKWSTYLGLLSSNNMKDIYISKSQKLLLETGLVSFNDGLYTLTPLVMRSLKKLKTLVRKEMDEISAQEILLPTLTKSTLLETSNRLELPDLFKLEKFEGKRYILSPTYEESITNFMTMNKNLSHKKLPVRFYQISNKFRDERRAKSSLLRSKEFVMKDLYCFEASSEKNEHCYQQVVKQYKHFFDVIKVPHICVKASPGSIGGLHSHEFHFLCQAGEDKILFCQECGFMKNCSDDKDISECSNCSSKNIKIENGIEVGHTFNLGTTYTKPFKATFINNDGKPDLLHMSSFGLGLTRIIGASIEVLCTEEEIRWPLEISPYLVCVIPPKSGSDEEKIAENIPELIYHNLDECLRDEIIYCDTSFLTVGKSLARAKKLGFPFVIVIGKSVKNNPPSVEVHDVYSGAVNFVPISDVTKFLLDKLINNSKNSLAAEKNVLQ